ncbi:TRAG protein [Leptospirillum ferriphilum]|uniref:TRAG protein n=2 Tax=Leptospirillum ferriphilum TaxID=178606 RepID=A0A094WBK3_9BACT|nr:type IV secretory system conjugative DNA transfer family protein [Leptospirillum ferriphilum]KGA93895.1 TRAG protein [Leptospirillum ferriphilum]
MIRAKEKSAAPASASHGTKQGFWAVGASVMMTAVILGGIMASCRDAYILGYQKSLWFTSYVIPWEIVTPLGKVFLYPPWGFLLWDAHFDSVREARTFLFSGNVRFVLTIAGGVVVFLLMSVWRGKNVHNDDLYGSSAFAKPSEIEKSGLLQKKGVVIGKISMPVWTSLNPWKQTKILRHDGPEHILMFAPTRSGKGVGFVIPTLLEWVGSVVVLDIKDENWKLTSGYRLSQKNRTIRFAPAEKPVDTDWCARWNPLSEIRTEHLIPDIQNIARMIVDPHGEGPKDHWAITAYQLLLGVLLYLFIRNHASIRTIKDPVTGRSPFPYRLSMSGLVKILSDPELTLDDLLKDMLDARTWMTEIDAKVRNAEEKTILLNAVREVSSYARMMMTKAPNELSGIYSTTMTYLDLYRDPVVAANTETSTFRMTDLMEGLPIGKGNRNAPVSLYLHIPDIGRLRPLIRLFFDIMAHRLTEKIEPPGRHKLLWLMDEFPALGRMDSIKEKLPVMAGYGIKAALICQDLSQVEERYGKIDYIAANCHVKVAYASDNLPTLKYLNEMLGKTHTVVTRTNYSGHRWSPLLLHMMTTAAEIPKDLMTIEELRTMKGSLVLMSEMRSIRAEKVRYYTDPLYRSLVMEPPNRKNPGKPVVDRDPEKEGEWSPETGREEPVKETKEEIVSEEEEEILEMEKNEI